MQRPDLSPALVRTIAHGPRAGQPRPATDVVLDQLTALRETAILLRRNGYRLLAAVADRGLPTIEVAAGSLTDEMIALGLAVHYKWTTANGVPERWGQFLDKPRGVRVVFVERPQ